jgi:hypothetical protein
MLLAEAIPSLNQLVYPILPLLPAQAGLEGAASLK